MIQNFFKKLIEHKECGLKAHENENLKELKRIAEDFHDHAELMAAVFSASQHSNEIVYIADIDTYQVLWANNRTIGSFGNIVGKKCYKSLQGFSEPCPFCTNKMIKHGGSYLWVYQNPIINRKYFIKDQGIFLNNRIVRYEIAYDITGMNLEESMR